MRSRFELTGAVLLALATSRCGGRSAPGVEPESATAAPVASASGGESGAAPPDVCAAARTCCALAEPLLYERCGDDVVGPTATEATCEASLTRIHARFEAAGIPERDPCRGSGR